MKYPSWIGQKTTYVWQKAGSVAWYWAYGRWPCVRLLVEVRDADPHSWAPDHALRERMMAMKRVVREDPGDDQIPVKVGVWAARYPQLVQVLTATCYDGKRELKREVGSLSLRLHGLMWQWSVTDPSSASVLRVEVPIPEDGLMALEKLLEGPATPWQHAPWLDKSSNGKKGKRT